VARRAAELKIAPEPITVMMTAGLQERIAAHMKALEHMRKTAEAAEAACCAAELQGGEGGRATASAGGPSVPPATVKPVVPGPPAAPPAVKSSASAALQRAGAVMMGILCELLWTKTQPYAPNGATQEAQNAEEHDDRSFRTCHGTIVKGSCWKVGTSEGARGEWLPCNEGVVADQCPVDVICVQATALLQHSRFAAALLELRHALSCMRRFCAAYTRSGPGCLMDSSLQHWQLTRSPGLPSIPVQRPAIEPTSLVTQDKSADAERATGVCTAEIDNCWVPQSAQQAVAVLGPCPAAVPYWSNTAVTFLGTGSSEPSKYRGPSALLLEVRAMVYPRDSQCNGRGTREYKEAVLRFISCPPRSDVWIHP
jgi:hypothetical protein